MDSYWNFINCLISKALSHLKFFIPLFTPYRKKVIESDSKYEFLNSIVEEIPDLEEATKTGKKAKDKEPTQR